MSQQLDAGVLVYFGYPHAHEDDAQRAVRSGLALVEALTQLASAEGQTGLVIRVGIDTGMVILSSTTSAPMQPALAVGSTATQALQLSAMARPGAVVIGEATRQLIQGYFDYKLLADPSPAGSGNSLAAYEVRGESGLQTRLEVGEIQGLTLFVGREAEVALLRERWTYVQEGLRQVVLIRAEAAMGKSRLVQVVKKQVTQGQSIAMEWRCSPYHQHTALYPFLHVIQKALACQATVSQAKPLETLERLLEPRPLPLSETVPLMAALLSLPLPKERYAPLQLAPPRQRERTLEMILALLLAQAAEMPMVFIVEDLHWTDPSTLDFLELLLDQIISALLLVMLTCRPTFAVPWETRPEVTPVVLQRLTQPQVHQMIVQVAGGRGFTAAEVTAQLTEKADGVPLFVEELTRMMVESGQFQETPQGYALKGKLAGLSIPATLQDLLIARLDRLGATKDIVQWGAVLGREFSYELLEAATAYHEGLLREGLMQLVEAGLVFQRGLFPQVHYRFKHALIQDSAYGSLLKRRRQVMHQRVAEVLEAHFPEVVASEPEWLAHHYTEAGLHEQAIPYWQQAGQLASTRSATQETIAHLTQGLKLLATLPETKARWQQELNFQVALGSEWMMAKGYGAPEVERAYGRALHLCQQVADTSQILPVLRGMLLHYRIRGQLQSALQFGEQMLHLASSQSDTIQVMSVHQFLGMVLSSQGKVIAACTHYFQAIAAYLEAPSAELPRYATTVPGVQAYSFLARDLWSLGYPDQAMEHSQTANALVREISHPYSRALALVFSAIMYLWRREPQVAYEQTIDAITLATEHGFAYWGALATSLCGWALAMQGQTEAGLIEIRRSLAVSRAAEIKMVLLFSLLQLADAYGESGNLEAGLETLTEALDEMASIETWFYAPELYCLKGVFLLRQKASDSQQAEGCFQQALKLPQQQETKSFELRSATCLARLWQHQGKCSEARDLLASVYGWFTEGFDTTDLKDAAALLETLRV